MGLEEYRARRDFGATPEPEAEQMETGQSRFVVQKHQARRLHYDFRLEMQGVLRSWALPKGPPTSHGVRRLAVHVEDHPVSYIDFSGTIPEGQYGAGTVQIWDHGKYVLEREEPDLLEFTLRGKRLSGAYVLVHTDGDSWLLMKRKQERS